MLTGINHTVKISKEDDILETEFFKGVATKTKQVKSEYRLIKEMLLHLKTLENLILQVHKLQ